MTLAERNVKLDELAVLVDKLVERRSAELNAERTFLESVRDRRAAPLAELEKEQDKLVAATFSTLLGL
jgi:hypothetical protein